MTDTPTVESLEKTNSTTQVEDEAVTNTAHLAAKPNNDQLPAPEASLAIIEDLIFPTAPLKNTYEKIRIPVVLRTSGCWFASASGEGKSTAATYCVEALRREFPLMPVFSINVHMLPATASRSIPTRLLAEVEHKVSRGDPTKLRMSLARSIAEHALRTPLRQCVLVLDEAQVLRTQDLFLMKDISNDLARHGTGFLTFMFGESPKMEVLESSTREGEDFGLAERFFVRRLDLCSYSSIVDWTSLLEQMDQCRFPELDGKTVPEAFLPPYRGQPYCLASEATRLWKALKQNRGDAPNLTLRRIFTAIRWWILHAGISLQSNQAIPKNLWNRAIAYACCVE